MQGFGKVIAVDGRSATVEPRISSKCEACTRRSKLACDTCPDNSELSAQRIIAYNKVGAKIGDVVQYGAAVNENIIFIILVFAMPLLAAIAGFILFSAFISDHVICARIAAAFFVVATVLAVICLHMRSKTRCEYSITGVVPEE